MAKLNERFEAKVQGISDDGSGVIEQPSKPVLVYHTIPGETVQVTARRKVRGAIRADLDRVVEPSPHRVAPLCPSAGRCGGCKWQHVDYAYQLAMKKSLVKQAFGEVGLACPVKDVVGSPATFYYRNRMDFVFDAEGNLGLKEPNRWWSTLNLPSCFICPSVFSDIMERVRAWTRGSGLPFWDVRAHAGFFRYLVIREGVNTGQRLVMLVTNHAPTPEAITKVQELRMLLDDVATSIVWGINPSIADLSFAQEMHALKGDPWLTEIINGISYRVYPNSFFQTNSVMAAELQNAVLDFAGDVSNDNVLDLYCGSGFFTLALARKAKMTYGLELDRAAIDAAKLNAAANRIDAKFVAGKAEAYNWADACPQLVVVDPPRSGLHPTVIRLLRSVLPQRIVYVSCNYKRFVDECQRLLDHYRIADMRALDMFPHTPHVELVTLLERT